MAPRLATVPNQPRLYAREDPWCSVVLIWIFVATPLAILPGRFASHYTAPKLAVLYSGSALLLWFSTRSLSGVPAFWRTSAGRLFYSLLILVIGSVLISSAFSADPWLSFSGTVWRRLGAINQATIFFIAAVLAARIYSDRSTARTLMLGIEVAGLIASVYAILQYAGFDPLISADLYTTRSTPAAVRPPATLGQATYFATFLLPVILIAASFRLRETEHRWRRVHEIIFFLSITALVLSGTRSALLGLAAGLCVLMYMHRAQLINRNTLTRMAYRALALAGIATVFLLLPAGTSLRVRLAQWVTDRAGGPRLMVWRDSFSLFAQHPIWGVGPEMFEPEFRKIESLELARAFPDHYHESPHNFFLEVSLSQGAVGLVLWAGLLSLGCWHGFAAPPRRVDSEAGSLSAALVAILISLQFCPLTLTNELYVLAVLAMLVGLTAGPMDPRFSRMQLPLGITRCAMALSLIPVVIGSMYVAQDILYVLAENRIINGDLAGGERWYGPARKFPMPGPNLEISRQMVSLARRSPPPLREDALAAAKRASSFAELGSAERFNALYQSALIATLTGDLRLAEAKLRQAIDAAPTWYRPRMVLASLLWATGRNEEAEHQAAIALKCAGRIETDVKRRLNDARSQPTASPARSPKRQPSL